MYRQCLEHLGTLHQVIIHSPKSKDESEGAGLAAGLIKGGVWKLWEWGL